MKFENNTVVITGGGTGIGARNIPVSPARVSLSTQALAKQNHTFRGSGGVSKENAAYRFRPAFMDRASGTTYLSRFKDGRVAPLHILDGLPDELVTDLDLNGRVRAVRDCVVAGFLRNGLFYTREQAARAIAH